MTKNLFHSGIILSLLFTIFFENNGFAQHEMFQIEGRAYVLDNAKSNEFFTIPDLEAKNGVLEDAVLHFSFDNWKQKTASKEFVVNAKLENVHSTLDDLDRQELNSLG